MNRITNKQYLIDITIKSLQAQQPSTPTKVKCELHYGDGSYLRIGVQPLLKNGSAFFCDQKLTIPFSPQVSIVFKLIRTNKKYIFLGHYSLQIEKMLAQKIYNFKIRDKLEECDAYADFQCKIIDKQLLAQSDTEEPELEVFPKKRSGGSNAPRIKQPFQSIKIAKPYSENNNLYQKETKVPMAPQEYAKLVLEAEDILKKRQKFDQRQTIIGQFSRDKHGNLKSAKIEALRERLNEVKKQNFNNNLLLYIIIALIAFFIGMKI